MDGNICRAIWSLSSYWRVSSSKLGHHRNYRGQHRLKTYAMLPPLLIHPQLTKGPASLKNLCDAGPSYLRGPATTLNSALPKLFCQI